MKTLTKILPVLLIAAFVASCNYQKGRGSTKQLVGDFDNVEFVGMIDTVYKNGTDTIWSIASFEKAGVLPFGTFILTDCNVNRPGHNITLYRLKNGYIYYRTVQRDADGRNVNESKWYRLTASQGIRLKVWQDSKNNRFFSSEKVKISTLDMNDFDASELPISAASYKNFDAKIGLDLHDLSGNPVGVGFIGTNDARDSFASNADGLIATMPSKTDGLIIYFENDRVKLLKSSTGAVQYYGVSSFHFNNHLKVPAWGRLLNVGAHQD